MLSTDFVKRLGVASTEIAEPLPGFVISLLVKELLDIQRSDSAPRTAARHGSPRQRQWNAALDCLRLAARPGQPRTRTTSYLARATHSLRDAVSSQDRGTPTYSHIQSTLAIVLLLLGDRPEALWRAEDAFAALFEGMYAKMIQAQSSLWDTGAPTLIESLLGYQFGARARFAKHRATLEALRSPNGASPRTFLKRSLAQEILQFPQYLTTCAGCRDLVAALNQPGDVYPHSRWALSGGEFGYLRIQHGFSLPQLRPLRDGFIAFGEAAGASYCGLLPYSDADWFVGEHEPVIETIIYAARVGEGEPMEHIEHIFDSGVIADPDKSGVIAGAGLLPSRHLSFSRMAIPVPCLKYTILRWPLDYPQASESARSRLRGIRDRLLDP